MCYWYCKQDYVLHDTCRIFQRNAAEQNIFGDRASMTVKQNNNNRINEALGEIVQYHIHAGIYILTNTLLFTRRMSGQLLVAQFHQQGIQRALQWVICLCKRFSQRRKGCRMIPIRILKRAIRFLASMDAMAPRANMLFSPSGDWGLLAGLG